MMQWMRTYGATAVLAAAIVFGLNWLVPHEHIVYVPASTTTTSLPQHGDAYLCYDHGWPFVVGPVQALQHGNCRKL